MNFLTSQRVTMNSLSKLSRKFAASTTARDKDKRLSELFRLPKHDLSHEKIFEKEPEEEELTQGVLHQYKNNEELDKVELFSHEFRRKRKAALNKTEQFFTNLNDEETVKLSENILERLRLKKEIKFDDEYKKRTILNEYGNYDKYFKNYTKTKETPYDSDDDGEMKWHMKLEELEEKYNNPNKLAEKAKQRQYQEDALKESLENKESGTVNFLHHLASKREDNPISNIDWESSYPDHPEDFQDELDEKNQKMKLLKKQQDDMEENKEEEEDEDEEIKLDIPEEEKMKFDDIEEEKNPDEEDDSEEDIEKLKARKEKEERKGDEAETIEISMNSRYHKSRWDRNPPFVAVKSEERRNMQSRDHTDKLNENENDYETFQSLEINNVFKKNQHVWGRLSPWAKEEIYRLYLEGWSVKDLSYKYGILPQRVKVIVWCRDTFWRDVYPKIGETGLKLVLEREMMYAHEYKFVDYGKDLFVMSQIEAGVELHKLDRTPVDTNPPKDLEEKLSTILRKIKPKKMNIIPLTFIGKGPHGYMVKEMIINRGHGSKRVTQMFKKFIMYSEKAPHLLPMNVKRKVGMPPRFACLGYRDKKK